MAQLTVFGKGVKKRLIDIDRNQLWLEREVAARTGMYVDNGYMYKILTGKRAAPKIVQAIREILNLPDQPNIT